MAAQAAYPARNAKPRPEQKQPAGKKKPRKKVIIPVVIVIIVIIAAIVGGVLFKQNQDNTAAHEPITVTVALSAEGYSDTGASGVPLHISGTDLDGNAVDEDKYLTGTSMDLELVRGEYTITFTGDAIDGTGAFYARPSQPIELIIDADGIRVQGTTTSNGANGNGAPVTITVVYTVVAPESITDEQIAAVQAWMKAHGCDDATINNLVTLAQNKRAARQAEIAEAERKAAEEKAAAEAAAAAAAAEAEKQAALASNPTSASTGSTVQLTGTVKRIYHTASETGMAWAGLWYILQLPSTITINGKSETEIQIYHGMNETSKSPYSEVEGQVVTVSGTLSPDTGTAHFIRDFTIPSASIVATY